MRKITRLETDVKNLKIKGVPLIVKCHADRLSAHNHARKFNYLISTRRRIGLPGYEIHRTK